MSPNTSQFLANAERLSQIITHPGPWEAASACSDWTAGAVLDHLVDTQRDLMAQRGFPLGDRPAGDPLEVWQSHLDAIRATLSDDAVSTTTYDGFFGPTTIGETLATFYGFDLLVHGWDIGYAWQRPLEWTPAEMTHIETAIAGFGDHLYLPGICTGPLEVRPDATRQEQLLGRLGRQPLDDTV
jgi:uncharacterized protein (TIGR03086 family)